MKLPFAFLVYRAIPMRKTPNQDKAQSITMAQVDSERVGGGERGRKGRLSEMAAADAAD